MNEKTSPSPTVLDFEKYVTLRHGTTRCRHDHTTVDLANREVTCRDCGKVVDPFDVLAELAKEGSHLQHTYVALQEVVKRLRQWNPFLRAIKRLEETWRGSMLPTCPHCARGIQADDLARSARVHKKFAK
ncbi:MAG: hypothetical protein ACYDCF_10845 [Burkholderiales bacterium]